MSGNLPPLVTPIDAQPDALVAKPSSVRPLNGTDVQAAKNSKFDKSLQDYEGVFLSQMVSHMYEGVGVDPNFGGGNGEQTMRSLLFNEYGKLMAARGGIGLAAAMKKQLLAMQEQQNAPAAPAVQAKDSQ